MNNANKRKDGNKAKEATSRRARGRRRNRRSNRNPPTIRLPRMPPPLSLNSFKGNLWFRNYVTVDSAISFIDNIGSMILFSGTNISAVFGEYKLVRVNIYYVPSAAVVTDPGDYAFSVIDSGEVKTAGDFKTIAMMPGSSIRKLYQTAQGVWFPTEPSDREWHQFDNVWSCFCVRIATTGTYKIGGYVVYDAHVLCRATSAAVKEKFAIERQPVQALSSSLPIDERLRRIESAIERLNIGGDWAILNGASASTSHAH